MYYIFSQRVSRNCLHCGCLLFAVTQIRFSDLTDVERIAEGGFGFIHRANHSHWGTVVYKELKASFIRDKSKFVLNVFFRH